MPTYEYECSKCGYTFERFQSMTDKPIRTCPQCGKRSVQRLIGAGAGLIFKGSGFYSTDYRSESYKKAAKKDGSGSTGKDAAGGSNGSSSKSDKKSA